jgi:hypothetical protein
MRIAMPCPHLKEVVMLYCDAFPVKKLVPLDRIVSAEPCLTHDFEHCPLFRPDAGDDATVRVEPLEGKEAHHDRRGVSFDARTRSDRPVRVVSQTSDLSHTIFVKPNTHGESR